MVYFLDTSVNLLLNLAGFSGMGDPHQILIAVVLGTAAVLWNSTLVPKWALGAFFSIMALASSVAIYALALGRQPTCIYEYDTSKPVVADSLMRKLTWDELRKMDCPTLWVARNEMYARSNYCFFTPIGYSYFGNDATCDPYVENPSTPIGEENARAIGRMSARKGCAAPMDSCKKLGRVSSSKLEIKRQTVKEVQ
ncbi:MAG: YARHG domain-containing protein [Hyphomicrobium sp.]